MAKVENTDPRLADAVAAMVVADRDCDDNMGNVSLLPILVDKARQAQRNFRTLKVELEKEPTATA